ncbi:unnamed protein product [Caenorhabditis sp. 36 PRJEB53466]|nr:unnamed protein product [Caenorhabditis sp. 36 PRJEB53466]
MSFNLAFFNGDVRRDRKQEAMLRSMNERDNFLNRLQEMERKREKDEKEDKSAKKIQKLWRGYLNRQACRREIRSQFDTLTENQRERTGEEVRQMAQLLINFYKSHKDEERLVMTLVELVKARTVNRSFEQSISNTARLLLARNCVKFLNQATENTIFFHIFRFLEDYVICQQALFEAASKLGLFEAELHLFEALVGKREGTIQKAAINPRHLQLLSRIFDSFVNPSKKAEASLKVADRLLKALCVTLPDDIFTNYIIHFIRDHIKPNNPNYGVFLEANRLADTTKWNVGPELLESCSVRLRSIFLSQIEHVDRSSEQTLDQFFVSLAFFLEKNRSKKYPIKEDFTQNGKLRNAANNYLEDYCQSILTSDTFRRSACTYANLPSIDVNVIVLLRQHFSQLLDTLAASNVFVEALYMFIATHSKNGDFDANDGSAPSSSALILFCNCLNKRVSSVADSDFVPSHIFSDFDRVVEFLRDVSIKLINLMFPGIVNRGDAINAELSWSEVTQSVFSILVSIYQKDTRIKYFPEGFWTNHGREVLSIPDGDRIARRRLRNGRLQLGGTVDNEFVTRLARIYESDSDDSDDSDSEGRSIDLPVGLRRAICVMKNIPFIVPFMDRVSLFNRLLIQEREKYYGGRPSDFGSHSLTVRRDNVYMDAFEQFAPRVTNDRVRELKAQIRVKMVNWTGNNESGIDGGGIFREFMSEIMKTSFNVDQGFFTQTESRLIYPNPTAPFLLGADAMQHYQFIGRMLGKLIYERQLQEVRFAEFFIAQLFESDKNKDIDLQHMKSFDPLIFKHLKDLLKLNEHELEELQLDFSVVTSDMGLVRNVNLKPNGSKFRVNVDNVHEYVRLYVNHHIKLRIAPMVDALRRGISEVINVEWMRMFAPHELQILIAGTEGVFSIKEMRKYCELRFQQSSQADDDFAEMFWDVIDKLSPEDKRALLKFVTGCSRPPIDGFRSIYPRMGILVVTSTDDTLPTSATCMNMLTIPKYSNRSKLEEKLRYAINSGAGFELS